MACPPPPPLDLHAQTARIDLHQRHIDKLLAENRRLFAETRTFDFEFCLWVLGAIIAGAAWRAPEIIQAIRAGAAP